MKLFYPAESACHQINLAMTIKFTKPNGLRNQPSFLLCLLNVTSFTVDNNKFITGTAILTYFLPVLKCHDHHNQLREKLIQWHHYITSTGKLYKTQSISLHSNFLHTTNFKYINYIHKFTNVHHCCVLQELSSVHWRELFRINH
jgi:hypothetical protein